MYPGLHKTLRNILVSGYYYGNMLLIIRCLIYDYYLTYVYEQMFSGGFDFDSKRLWPENSEATKRAWT